MEIKIGKHTFMAGIGTPPGSTPTPSKTPQQVLGGILVGNATRNILYEILKFFGVK